MTREQWAKLSDKEKQIKIAELCGWENCHTESVLGHHKTSDPGEYYVLPDYLNDLNTMHEAEKMLIARGGLLTYEHHLRMNEVREDGLPWYGSIHATAAERAEAFVLTMDAVKEKT